MLLPLPTHDKFCWSWNRVYLKANGRVPCWCDAGEPHTIIHKDLNTADFITDIVNSPQMRQMRLTIIEGGKPYIKQCHKCCCYQEQGKAENRRYHDSEIANDITHQSTQSFREMQKVATLRGWPIGSIDKINELQVEPAFPCNLRCPGCLHGWHVEPMKTEVAPYFLPLEWFKRVIDSVQEHAVKLERIAFVGRGEPTLNKKFPQMLEYARANLPRLVMSMDTNSTHQFKPEYLLMDWINCSIDGSTKEAYDTYRLGGNFDAAINFMRTAAEAKKSLNRRCRIRWKYILFNTNSEIWQLDKAQEMANDMGIDELDFVVTACGAFDKSVMPSKTMSSIVIVNDYINSNKIFPNTMVSRS